MPLHPQCQTLIDAAARDGSPFAAADPRSARLGYDAGTLVYRHPTPALDSVTNLGFAGAAGPVAVRVYRPQGARRPAPVLVYYHGGGWVVGNLESHDHLCRYLAATSGVVVVAVDYRLAPEHKFPAAYDDAVAALRWVAGSADELGIDAKRMAVGGDSAGGSLAAAVALAVRDQGWPMLRLQLLMYPSTDFTADTASMRENAEGYLLTRAGCCPRQRNRSLEVAMHESLVSRDPEIMSGALCFSGKRVLVMHLFGRVGPQLGRVAQPVKADIAPYPVEVALFSAHAVMSYPQPVAHLVEQARRDLVRRRRDAWGNSMNCVDIQRWASRRTRTEALGR